MRRRDTILYNTLATRDDVNAKPHAARGLETAAPHTQ